MSDVWVFYDDAARETAEDTQRWSHGSDELLGNLSCWDDRALLCQVSLLVVNDLSAVSLLIFQALFSGIFVLFEGHTFVNKICSSGHVLIIKFSNNVLLLNHLNFLDNDLEVYQRKVIKMLQENPKSGHGSSIDHLHKLSYLHVLVALKTLIGHMTLVRKLFENVS